MENKIGEIITLPDGRKAKVVEGFQCESCCIKGAICDYMKWFNSMDCFYLNRTDHKNIIYKEIKED